MITREEIVDEAIRWVGTPWKRNASLRGVGADCVGVIAGVAIAVGIRVSYRNDYSQRPDGSLRGELERQMVRVSEPLPGDVLLMTFGNQLPHHVAFYIGSDIVHAYLSVRRCVRQPYDEHWRSKVRGTYGFKEVT